MPRASAPPHKPAIDTTGKPGLEAKWQALVRGVIDAKAAADSKRKAWADACQRRGPAQTATAKALADVDKAKAEYDRAVAAVKSAGERMKAGDLS